jgi:hypothetical protein
MEYVHYPVMSKEILEYLTPPLDREAHMVDWAGIPISSCPPIRICTLPALTVILGFRLRL